MTFDVLKENEIDADRVISVFDRRDIEQINSKIYLDGLISFKGKIAYRENVEVSLFVNDHDNVLRELCEVKELRRFFRKLDKNFPH